MNRPVPADHHRILERLHIPAEEPLRVVIDTDTYNEVDDQFAVVYALRSTPRIAVDAIYAAPFHYSGAPFFNKRSSSPEEGMQRSFDEIGKVLELVDRTDVPTYRGATSFLPDGATPVPSEASRDLIRRARSSDEPLYVLALAALTNIASAILEDPSITDRIVVVWLGGHPLHWPHAVEFNLSQDVSAARILLDCGIPLVQMPLHGVVSHLTTTVAELEAHIDGRSRIGSYLTSIVRNYTEDHFAWSKIICDVATVAHVIDASWVPTYAVSSPILSDDQKWIVDRRRHPIMTAWWADRDKVFGDLFRKINQR